MFDILGLIKDYTESLRIINIGLIFDFFENILRLKSLYSKVES